MNTFEEHDKLELEEDDVVYRRATANRIEWSNKITYKGEVKGLVGMTIKAVGRDKLV